MATERVTRYVRLVIDASGAKSGSRETKRALDDINRSVKRTSNAMVGFNRLIAGAFIASAVRDLARYADSWNLIGGRLAVVTGSTEAAAAAQQRILEIANSSRQSLEGVATVYQRIGAATEHLNLSGETLARVTEGVALSFRVGGASAQEAAGASIQLAQGLGSGALQGEELRSVLENNIPLAKAIAAEFGVNVAQLRDLGKQGKLTAERVIPAILNSLDEFRDQAAQIPETIGGAFQVLENNLIATIGQFDDATGASNIIAQAILLFANNLDTVAAALGGIAVAAIPKLIAGFKVLATIVANHPLVRLASIAAAVGVAVYELTQQTVSYGDHSAKVGTILGVVWDNVLASLKVVYDFAAGLFSDWGGWFSDLIGSAGITFGDIQTFAKNAVNTIIGVGVAFYKAWIGYFKALWEAAKATFQGIGNSASAALGILKGIATLDFDGAGAVIDDLKSSFDFSGVGESVSATMTEIGDAVGKDYIGALEAVVKPGLERVFSEAATREAAALEQTAVPGSDEVTDFTGTGGGTSPKGGGSKQRATDAAEEAISLAKVHDELDRGIELAKMYNGERAIESELRKHLDELSEAGIELTKAETDALRDKIEQMQLLGQLQGDLLSAGEIVFDGLNKFVDGFSGAIVDAARTGKFEIKSMVSDILAEMAKLALNSIFKQLLGNFLGGLGGGGGGLGSALGGLLGFAQGGDFTVGGGGATDSKLVAFRASPGERVSFERPDQVGKKDSTQNIKVVNVIDPQQTLDALATSAGERVILNTIERNPAAVQQMLSR